MQWSREAEEAISKVPFFVRKRVRKGVDEEAIRSGVSEVGMEHVNACRGRFFENMEDEVKGHQIERCFGASECPNRVTPENDLEEKIRQLMEQRNLKEFLKKRVKGPLKVHHEFRISVSYCPNACSRPQIVDVGLIGASKPQPTSVQCTECAECIQVCREGALTLMDNSGGPSLNESRCLGCGQCIRVCPSGTLEEDRKGYRVLLGGKLGRHPQLGLELPGVYSERQVLELLEKCLDHYMRHNETGERFGEVINRAGLPQTMRDG